MYYIGIDIGGMSIKASIVDSLGTMYGKGAINTVPNQNYQKMFYDIATLCEAVTTESGLTKEDVSGVGIGIPGTIDDKKGIIVYSNNIAFQNVPIVKEMSKYYNCPIKIGNDANVAALGEWKFGAGKGLDHIILITLGTGIGTGIIVDGKIISGLGGAGGEGGHITIKMGGDKCTCGKRGCWEVYASATGLIKHTTKALAKNPDSLISKFVDNEGRITGRTAFEAAKLGDKVALAVVRKYINYVAEGIVSLNNIFRPSCFLIGGGISNEGDDFVRRIERQVNKLSYGGKINPRTIVKKAILKNDAGILGAAALCM